MPNVSALEFPRMLDENGPQPVYALVGEEGYLIRRCLHALRDSVETPDAPGSMTREFEGEADSRDVFDELRTAPFMGMKGRRLVILRNAGKFASSCGDTLAKYIRKPSPTSMLVMVFKNVDGRTSVGKAVKDCAVTVDGSGLRWRQAENWIRAEARNQDKQLTPRAARSLMQAVGSNLFQLENELDKLVQYAADKTAITEEDVEEVVPHSRSHSIFDIGDAVARGEAKKDFNLGYSLLLRGESVHGLVSILARRVRQLWRMKRMKRARMGQKQMAGKLGVPPFVIRNSMELLSRLTDRFLARQMRLLAAADYELKTSSLASKEEEAWLVKLLARLCSRKNM